MENSSYVSVSSLSALERQIAIRANNMANANTPGYRSERAVFETYLENQQGTQTKGGVNFVIDSGSYLDTRPGALDYTGSRFDLAVQGDGWFGYQTADGAVGLGRDGQLMTDGEGFLATGSGHRILDDGGAPIVVPNQFADITVAPDGTISTPGGDVLARVGVFRGADIQAYMRGAGGLFMVPDGTELEPVIDASVVQGAIEGSNVDPVVEMVRMIEVQRTYERSVQSLNKEDDLLKETLSRLSRPA